MKKLIALLILSLFAAACSTPVRGTTESTTPVVQNAKWASKWWMPRHKEKIALKKKMAKVDLLFIGDSITHAWDGKGKAVWDQYYSKRNALNIGFSGDRTEHVLWRLENGAVDDISPKLAVMMIGTNNAGHRQEKSALTALGIKAILQDLETRLPETKILLLAVFPRGATKEDKLRKLTDGTNEIIRNYADGDRVHYLSINDQFLTENGTLPRSVMRDLLHPNPDQYKVWAEAIEADVARLMAE